jgi:serine protease Do
MTTVKDVGQSVAEVAGKVGPSVVRIGRGPGRGAGVVVAEGAVLTNSHNLRGGEVTVTFADGRREVGSVAGVDVDGDLAVVHVDTKDAAPVAWAEGDLALGEHVLAVTVPADAGLRVTSGTVSAVGRAFRGPRGRLVPGGVEHTAPLARGSSGSPLLDAEGRLVGISTHRLGDGFYLAVPADAALRERVQALGRGESPRGRYLGIALHPSRVARRLRASVGLPEREGLLVSGVEPDGPAARAGVRGGDLVVAAGGTPLTGPDDLFEILRSLGSDDPLTLRIVRGTEEVEVRVPVEATSGEGSA